MLDIKDLEVGKKYRHVAGDLQPSFKFTSDTFIVLSIDEDGDVRVSDCTWCGDSSYTGWYLNNESRTSSAENGILKFEEVV